MTRHPPPDLLTLCGLYRLDEAGKQVVLKAYWAFRDHHGPFITYIVAKVLPDLRRDIEDGRLIVFLGRDSHGLAYATKALCPIFFGKYCREAMISRTVVEEALQDLELYLKKDFPQVEQFRQVRGKVDPRTVLGAHQRLTTYLQTVGVPVGPEGGAVTLVNTSFKGTIQELLSAIYPSTDFIGRYAFFGASPHDPHPGTKYGYVVDLPAERTCDGQGIPFRELPDDSELTFACREAIAVIEHTLHGPLDSPRTVTGLGPAQKTQRRSLRRTDGDAGLVDSAFRDPDVLEAVKTAALLAVYDAARDIAVPRTGDDQDADEALLAHLSGQPHAFTEQIRAWIRKESHVDPDLKIVLDNMVLPSKIVPTPAL
ncbi:ABC transporter permease [Streptomyces violaceus]|uniref:ABC transporter permease n=1 Tax=Streptomyces violaceus TaxID=1936 RepID=A0ABY9U6K1_STRVL|nr:ABC transporter permease [Streptomyces janthinus]WND18185.1 ABC transporter permease [Streptomyces janthinus]GGS74667.1 hypothetical protein GCM10010270_52970 [Streptomyces janthinus]